MGQSWWQLDWIWTVTGWTLAAIGAVLLLWALFWDRARGRKRCPKCWYDMSGLSSVTCPECGRPIRSPRQLRRTRRRWQVAIATIPLFLLSYWAFVFLAVKRNGWPAALPDVLLVWATPLDGPYWPANPGVRGDGTLLRELQRRVEERELSPLGYRLFLPRYFDRLPEERKRIATTRAAWPRGEHVYAQLWWPMVLWKQADDLMVRARLSGGTAWVESRVDHGIRMVDIGAMPADGRSAEIELEIVQLREAKQPGQHTRETLYRGKGATIAALPAGQDGMTAFDDPRIASAILSSWQPTVLIEPDGSLVLRTDLIGYHIEPSHPDWSLSVRVELLQGERVLAKHEFVEYMPSSGTIVDFIGSYGFREMPKLARGDLLVEPGPFRLRITGDRRLALRDIERTSFWSGTLEVPLTSPLPRVNPDDWDYKSWRQRRLGE